MNREIKFRAWDGKQMRYLSNIFVGVGQIGFSDKHYVDLNDMDQEQVTIMQFTGIKDKNGVEIFEGDLLGGIYESLQVKWCVNQGSFELFYLNECYACNGDIFWRDVVPECPIGVEVVGNIYMNPELLTIN